MINVISLPSPDKFYHSVVWITLSLIALLFIVEILQKLNDVPNDNVNLVIRRWAYRRFYFITFFTGVVTAHLFFGTTKNWFDCKIIGVSFGCDIFNVLVVAGLNILLLIGGVLTQKTKTKITTQYILFALGLIVGHFVWSMNKYT